MLEKFFCPTGVAIIGAAREEGKVGHELLDNLLAGGYRGRHIPVNPNAKEIHGIPVVASISDIRDHVDLAVVAVKNKFVPGVIRELGEAGIKAAVVISAGFKESGREGAQLEHELVEVAHRYGVRLLGPNCLGVIDTACRLNASFARDMPRPGHIAFMSQSGALGAAILDWAIDERIGFSKFVSVGNKADLTEVDFMREWAHDDGTGVVAAYVEGITDGRAFMDGAREVTARKPLIVMKGGVTDSGARAASSHTGALAGSEAAYAAAFKQTGITRAHSVGDLFDFTTGLADQPLPDGFNLAIISNAGGPAIMAADAADTMSVSLAAFEHGTVDALREKLPPAAALYNPVDVLGDAGAERYRFAIGEVAGDEHVNAIMVILTPQAMTDIEGTARAIGEAAKCTGKPVYGCFMGGRKTHAGARILSDYGIPNYRYPERAVGAVEAAMQYVRYRRRDPGKVVRVEADTQSVSEKIAGFLAAERTWLVTTESFDLIKAYGIRSPQIALAHNRDEALRLLEVFEPPVALKVVSPDILHKSDIGGIRLGLRSGADVGDAFDEIIHNASRFMPDAVVWGVAVQEMAPAGTELIVGIDRDPQFGPVLLFGLGGIYVEVLKDVSTRVAPISRQDALDMVNEVKSSRLLYGYRGSPPADVACVVDTLLRVSQLAVDFPQIIEMDLNPLMVYSKGEGCMAVDVRISLGE